jgi:hypothetical protein
MRGGASQMNGGNTGHNGGKPQEGFEHHNETSFSSTTHFLRS